MDASNPQCSRLVALDYGEARIGVAGSDDLGILAHPLETVAAQPRGGAITRISAIVRERKAAGIVVGLPLRADGEEGAAAEKVRAFVEALRPHLPAGFPIYFQDEYRSTVQAAEHLRASGKRTKTHRPLIDQAAAVVILQDYLDALPEDFPSAPSDEAPGADL
jgi:putative holliday junction resolvase